jgi:hypothetical protein
MDNQKPLRLFSYTPEEEKKEWKAALALSSKRHIEISKLSHKELCLRIRNIGKKYRL